MRGYFFTVSGKWPGGIRTRCETETGAGTSNTPQKMRDGDQGEFRLRYFGLITFFFCI